VRNHRLPITTLEYKKDGAYVAMKRESYNYFVEANGVGDQPSGLELRLTAADGQTLIDTVPGTITENTLVAGSVQFR
jgi:expansin (peptidoglycan-binding protein)